MDKIQAKTPSTESIIAELAAGTCFCPKICNRVQSPDENTAK